ncbi:MAG: SMC-Scp complex subunit ScpB [Nitrospiraceae bacterium]|nr:MAG: SMC-Scp complex subunit ScpB [Nitrospiraceae bacterium]
MQDEEAKSVIEAILFMAGEPVSLDTIRKITEIDKYNTDRLTRELISDYSVRNTGLFIVEVAEGYQMVTNPACAPWVKKLLSTSVPKKLSQSSLETMAIIAYKQPIIKAEIEAIRGVNSDGVVKTLLDKRLVKILGRKEVPGRPLMYGTTKEFLQYFGLKDLSELPTLKEFQEVDIPEPGEGLPETASASEYTSGQDETAAVSVGTGQTDPEPHMEDATQSGDEQEYNGVHEQEADAEGPSTDEAVRTQE